MGTFTAKTRATSAVLVRRRRSTVAGFRRDRRTDDEAKAIPDWGRIVFRAGVATTLR